MSTVSTFADVCSFSSIFPLIPKLESEGIRLQPTALGFVLSLYGLFCIFSSPAGGSLTRHPRVGLKRLMLLGALLMASGSLLFLLFLSLGAGVLGLVSLRVLQGVGTSFTWTAAMGSTAAVFVDAERPAPSEGGFIDRMSQATANAITTAGVSVGMLLGPVLGGTLYEKFGFSSPFLASLAVSLLTLFGLFVGLPDRLGQDEGGAAEVRLEDGAVADVDPAAAKAAPISTSGLILVMLKSEACVSGLVCYASLAAVSSFIEVMVPLFADHRFTARPSTTGAIFAVSGVLYALSAPTAGHFSTPSIFLRLMTAGTLIMFLALFLTPFSPNMATLAVLTASSWLGSGLATSSAFPEVISELAKLGHGPEVAGQAAAAANLFYYSGMVTGPILAGILMSINGLSINLAFIIASLSISGLPLALLIIALIKA